ncbi:hypothetical protein BT63DRAFT_429077 [Microthyrium microscopicum]|uniref:Uncharacterized protein n=1 Tax=Microthyrium microscopicum TaxID=703497 RepID=A0A6A6U0K7_9PEZI|nr:hypothetical protein BT63DRAFT_429077 [Microthyrium microscopicum]
MGAGESKYYEEQMNALANCNCHSHDHYGAPGYATDQAGRDYRRGLSSGHIPHGPMGHPGGMMSRPGDSGMQDPRMMGMDPRMQMGMNPQMQMGMDPRMQMGMDPRMQMEMNHRMQMEMDPRMQMGIDPRMQIGMDQRRQMMDGEDGEDEEMMMGEGGFMKNHGAAGPGGNMPSGMDFLGGRGRGRGRGRGGRGGRGGMDGPGRAMGMGGGFM